MFFHTSYLCTYLCKYPSSVVHYPVRPHTHRHTNRHLTYPNTHIALSGNENPNGQRGRVVARYRSRLKPQIPATAGTPRLTQPLYRASACPLSGVGASGFVLPIGQDFNLSGLSREPRFCVPFRLRQKPGLTEWTKSGSRQRVPPQNKYKQTLKTSCTVSLSLDKLGTEKPY